MDGMRVWWWCLVAACSFDANVPAGTIDAAIDAPRDASTDATAIDASTMVDTDGDGRVDASDNCPLVANANQADEDTDLVGNVCDNCPHVANATQANVMETNAGQVADGVGDACDPLPEQSGQQIALFMPFDDANELAGWQSAGTNASFTIGNGRLTQSGATDLAILWKNNLGFRSEERRVGSEARRRWSAYGCESEKEKAGEAQR